MKIQRLRINHIKEPLGYQLDGVTASWTVEKARGKHARWTRVQAALDKEFCTQLYDSGESGTLDSRCCPLPIVLSPRTRYYWRVTVMDDSGDTASAVSWFETGKQGEAYQAQWIAAPFEKDVHPVFQKKFSLNRRASSARLYISGLGLYECYINNIRVSDEVLTPYCNDYDLWVQAQTWDVTKLLKAGENCLEICLGNGWYKGRFGFGKETDCIFGEKMICLAELRAQCAGEPEFVLGTDASFLCRPGATLSSSIYDGELFDARLLKSKGRKAYAEIASPPKGALADRLSPPLRVMEERKPVELIHTPAGEQVLDFGQVVTGWVAFDAKAPRDHIITLDYGELLQNDNFYNGNLRTAKQRYQYISAGGAKAHACPRFTFFGFRYVRVTGLENFDPEDFTACVIHSELDRTGSLETSNAKVNRLIQNALWGQKGNFVDVPTDCPQRDERMGWTGDAQVFAPTACFTMDSASFYTKYLHDMALEQDTLNGAVPHVVPDVIDKVHLLHGEPANDYGSCAWADAAVIIPWTLYRFYGDRVLLRKQFPQMRAWVDWVETQDETHHGGSRLWMRGHHFADWLALDNPDKQSCYGGTDPYYIASAYYMYSARLAARAAEALGETETARHYAQLSEEVREAIRKEYFTSTGRIAEPTQTALALALALNIAPEQARERLRRDLSKRLEMRSMHLDTGFVGTYFLMSVLTDNELGSHAYALLMNEDYPSWLYEVNMGATTVWERWNSVLPNGLVSDTGMNSMNHYAYGSVVEWMYRKMCGLNEDAPGFASALITPHPDQRLSWARAAYDSASGRYISGWKRERSGRIVYTVEVPFGAKARFMAPDPQKRLEIDGQAADTSGEALLEPGRHTIRELES